MSFIREEDLISRKLETCENCEWCVPTLKALDEAGVEYRKTIYDSGKVFYPSGHFSWTPAYANKEMRNWLFDQVKK